MTTWAPRIDESGPVYLAITRAIEADIASGRLQPADRLPTHRDLAAALGVNVGTVSRAYAEARRRGLIAGTVGRGTFVRAPHEPALVRPEGAQPSGGVDLGVNVPLGMPSPDLPAALAELARRGDLDAVMAYQEPAGTLASRRAGADWLERIGVPATPEHTVVCAGAQHAILVALGALAGPGDLVLAERLTYPGFLGAARMLGQRVRGVETDADGLLPDALDEACRSDRPRVLYCMPGLHNPTCAQLPAHRREAIAEIAARHDLMIVQDEIQGGMVEDDAPSLASLAPDRVVTIASLSKLLSPGLRVAYVAAPAARVARLGEAVWSSVWMSSPLGAEVANLWLADGTLERILRLRCEEMDARHRSAARLLDGLGARTRARAYQLWLPLPAHWESRALAEALLREGVRVSAAEEFSADARPAPDAIRISLSATRSRRALEQGLRTIRRVVESPPRPGTRL